MKPALDLEILQNTLLECLNSKANEGLKFEKDDALNSQITASKNVVVVCFGTPLVSGDAFAPLVADALKEDLDAPVFVYGTTINPVSAKNMSDWLDFVKVVHKGDLIIAVDASLGDKVGGAAVRKDGVCPAAVKGKKRRFGDVGILGIVAKAGEDPLVSLMNVEYGFVEELAEICARAISQAILNFNY